MAAINATAISLFYRKQELLLCPLSLCLGGMEAPGCREVRGGRFGPAKQSGFSLFCPRPCLARGWGACPCRCCGSFDTIFPCMGSSSSFEFKHMQSDNHPRPLVAPRSAFCREGTSLARCGSFLPQLPPQKVTNPSPGFPPRPAGFLSMASLPRGKVVPQSRPLADHAPLRARPGTAPFVTPSASAGGRRAPLAAGRVAMAAGSVWKGLVGLGLFALAHAAFSAAQRE